MRGVSIEVQGLDRLIKKFEKMPAQVTATMDAELDSIAQDYQNRAHSAAPTNIGQLGNEITYRKVGEMNYEVVSGAVYSAYVEFGTRSKVQIPAGLESVAAQFRGGRHSSLNAKEAIFRWCKDKGIPQEAWYPIFIKLMVVGMNPHPFFFTHLPWAQSEVSKRSKQVIKNAL